MLPSASSWFTLSFGMLFSENAVHSPLHEKNPPVIISVTATRADAGDNEGFGAAPSETPSWKVGVMSERVLFLPLTEVRVFFSRSGFASVTFKCKPRNGKRSKQVKQTIKTNKQKKTLLRWAAPCQKMTHIFFVYAVAMFWRWQMQTHGFEHKFSHK